MYASHGGLAVLAGRGEQPEKFRFIVSSQSLRDIDKIINGKFEHIVSSESWEVVFILIFDLKIFYNNPREGVQPEVQFLRQVFHPWLEQGLHVVELVVTEQKYMQMLKLIKEKWQQISKTINETFASQ